MWSRQKTYYIAYDVHLNGGKIVHGSATFTCIGNPEIEEWIKEIREFTEGTGESIVIIQVLSCILVDKGFIND